jgi:antirestriction protein
LPQGNNKERESAMQTIKIWLGNLGDYNAGKLNGEWISLPQPEDDLAALVEKYTLGGNSDYFIADYEADFPIKEHVSLSELNTFAETFADLDDYDAAKVCYLIDDGCGLSEALEEFEDVIFYEGMTLKQVAMEHVNEGLFGDIPDAIASYIDYESLARDLGFDGYEETPKGVFRRG